MSSTTTVNRRLLQSLACIALAISLFYAIRYRGQPILEAHAFRQTQTAITSYWMSRHGFHLSYWTPCCGAPWSVPFEFPIYQWIVSVVATTFRWDLQETGRLVSYAFLLLCLWPVRNALKRLYPNDFNTYFLCFAALFLTSPLYLFWGRSFLMETAALFFTLGFLAESIPLLQLNFTWPAAWKVGIFLTLALLQKVTTCLPAGAVVGAILLYQAFRHREKWSPTFRLAAQMCVAFVLPLVIGYVWIRFSDAVKMLNPVGMYLTSSAIKRFNFGYLHQRWSRTIYIDVLWKRVMMQNIAGPIGCAVIAAGFILFRGMTRNLIAISLAIFLLTFLVFENLHWVHNYYQSSLCIYVIFAASVALSKLMLAYPERRRPLGLLLTLMLISNFVFFRFRGYGILETYPLENNRTIQLGELIRQRTDPKRPILVFGYDYSSEVQFFSQRLGLAVPFWMMSSIKDDVLNHPVKYLGEIPSAIVACNSGNSTESILDPYIGNHQTAEVQDCRVVFNE